MEIEKINSYIELRKKLTADEWLDLEALYAYLMISDSSISSKEIPEYTEPVLDIQCDR